MIENITFNDKTLAIIIRKDHHENGIKFLTEEHYSQQLAYMHHPKGKIIDAHIHNFENRNVIYTQEVLIIRKGKLRVDFYQDNREYIESYILNEGDIIFLASGGHGFEVLEELEMVEVKQGPYLGERDKVRFDGISASEVIVKGENNV
jgi:mannose-6-phosphate isomerase-like protein (cupin superfamily)